MALGAWVAEDGTPLKSDLSAEIEAGVLMIKAKNRSRIQREYSVSNGRLVVVKETDESQGDAAGHGMQMKQVSELKLDATE